jgi:hypothetical protein
VVEVTRRIVRTGDEGSSKRHGYPRGNEAREHEEKHENSQQKRKKRKKEHPLQLTEIPLSSNARAMSSSSSDDGARRPDWTSAILWYEMIRCWMTLARVSAGVLALW